MSRTSGHAQPWEVDASEINAARHQLHVVPEGEAWPPLTDADLDAMYEEHMQRVEEEGRLRILPHVHPDCGHECHIIDCGPGERLCMACMWRLHLL